MPVFTNTREQPFGRANQAMSFHLLLLLHPTRPSDLVCHVHTHSNPSVLTPSDATHKLLELTTGQTSRHHAAHTPQTPHIRADMPCPAFHRFVPGIISVSSTSGDVCCEPQQCTFHHPTVWPTHDPSPGSCLCCGASSSTEDVAQGWIVGVAKGETPSNLNESRKCFKIGGQPKSDPC